MQKAPKSNLSKLEWADINDLKNDKNIEIMEADKGGSAVILSKSHYKSMIISKINDEKTDKKLNSNPDQAIMKKLKALITKYNSLLTDSEYNTSVIIILRKVTFMAALKYTNRKFYMKQSENKIKNLLPFQNRKT